MASVPLVFNLPAEEGLTALNIYEAISADGPWTLIETVTEIGTYPDYIHDYETDNATSEDNWFAISTVDQADVESDLSVPMKGGTQTVVNMVTERVMQRGVTWDESIVIQEAEAVIERWFGIDPYTVPLPVSYTVLSGLTYLVMARLIVQSFVSGGSSESYTAGLVSQKTGTSQTDQMKFVDDLIRLAAQMLGVPEIVLLQMADFDPTGLGTKSTVSFDQTRLALTINYE